MDLRRKILGQKGEEIAAGYLQSLGYQILQRNLRYKIGEIDLVAQDGDFIVLVEVKTKQDPDKGAPEEEVDWWKQKKLRLLAKRLSQDYPDQAVRIDVVAIDKTQPDLRLNHLINAVEG